MPTDTITWPDGRNDSQAATVAENVQEGARLQLVFKIGGVGELTANPALRLYLFGEKKKKTRLCFSDGFVSHFS